MCYNVDNVGVCEILYVVCFTNFKTVLIYVLGKTKTLRYFEQLNKGELLWKLNYIKKNWQADLERL